MLTTYIRRAMARATYETLKDQTSYGEIPGIQGVWANESTLETCHKELESALTDWLLYGLRELLPIPVIDGIDLNATLGARNLDWEGSHQIMQRGSAWLILPRTEDINEQFLERILRHTGISTDEWEKL